MLVQSFGDNTVDISCGDSIDTGRWRNIGMRDNGWWCIVRRDICGVLVDRMDANSSWRIYWTWLAV